MSVDIEANVARINTALNTPTLTLLDRKSAAIALPIFAALFPPGAAEPIPVERFHTRVDALLDTLRAAGYPAPAANGKALSMQWMEERWLYRDLDKGQETFRLTGSAEQALDYVNRATRTQLGVSLSRIETMRKVVSDAAMAANPDREERKRRLAEEIDRLTAEYERLDAGGDLKPASDTELTEQFSNVLRELDGLPTDFRRVEEAVRRMHKDIATRFREEDRIIGDVVDDYLDESNQLLTGTPEGRAFAGALELLRKRDWLASLRHDLDTILAHPLAGMMLPDEATQLRTTVDTIRRGIADVLAQRQRLTTTLREHIENYDHVRNRELDEVLRGIDRELRTWMKQATTRDHVEVTVIPSKLDLDLLKLRLFDPDSERPPEPLVDLTNQSPPALSLDQIRKQGGPSLDQLRQRIEDSLHGADVDQSAAALFNDLPDDLKRPVEILGMLHLFAHYGADMDTDMLERVEALRPDGTSRAFLMPAPTLPEEANDA